MRSVILGVAVAALAGCTGVSVSAGALDETEHVSRTAKLAPGATLRVKNFSGRVTITAADRNDVAVEAVRRGTRDQLDRIKLDIHDDGSTLVVDANHHDSTWDHWGRNNVVETELEVQVPRKTNLDIRVFSSPVTVQGVEGSHNVHGFSSRLKLDDIAGPVRAHTFSGSVEIREKTWQPRQAIDVDTFSGSIEVHVPESAKASVSFHSFSGRLNSEMPLTFNESTRRTISGRLGAADADAGELRLKTFSGSARIER
jgi:hypothetical protein